MRVFENFVLAANDEALCDVRKRALLLHCLGADGQHLFDSLPVAEDTYSAALTTLKERLFLNKICFVNDHKDRVN